MTVQPADPTQLESWEAVLLRAAHEMSLTEAQYDLIGQRYGTLQSALNAARTRSSPRPTSSSRGLFA